MADHAANDDLALAHELADLADGVTLPRWRAADLQVLRKPDMSPVSDADTAVEALIRECLAVRRPEDAILGEEQGGAPSTGGRRWILDPIDGTRNYVRGHAVFATLVALEVDGRIDVGVVSAPAMGRRWWAERGRGAHTGASTAPATRLRVSAVEEIGDAYVSGSPVPRLSDPALLARWDALAARAWHARGLGDFWQHMLVAEGTVDVALDLDAAIWDYAALSVIVDEAGGRFGDLDGSARHDGRHGLSTNGRLHAAVVEALAAPPG